MFLRSWEDVQIGSYILMTNDANRKSILKVVSKALEEPFKLTVHVIVDNIYNNDPYDSYELCIMKRRVDLESLEALGIDLQIIENIEVFKLLYCEGNSWNLK